MTSELCLDLFRPSETLSGNGKSLPENERDFLVVADNGCG
jgi:hypothetical protein